MGIMNRIATRIIEQDQIDAALFNRGLECHRRGVSAKVRALMDINRHESLCEKIQKRNLPTSIIAVNGLAY